MKTENANNVSVQQMRHDPFRSFYWYFKKRIHFVFFIYNNNLSSSKIRE